MATSNTRFTQNSLGQSKNPIDSDHGIYRYSAKKMSETIDYRSGHAARPLSLSVITGAACWRQLGDQFWPTPRHYGTHFFGN